LSIVLTADDAPPFVVGSGKFATPCERMHSANLSAAASGIELAGVVDLVDDPQAAIAIAHVTAASLISTLRPVTLTIDHRCRARQVRPDGKAVHAVARIIETHSRLAPLGIR